MGAARQRQPGVWEARVYVGWDPSAVVAQAGVADRARRWADHSRPPEAVAGVMHHQSRQEGTVALGEAGVALLRVAQRRACPAGPDGDVELAADTSAFSDRIEGTTPVRSEAATGFFTSRRLPHPGGGAPPFPGPLGNLMAMQLASRVDLGARTLAGRLGHADASVGLKAHSASSRPPTPRPPSTSAACSTRPDVRFTRHARLRWRLGGSRPGGQRGNRPPRDLLWLPLRARWASRPWSNGCRERAADMSRTGRATRSVSRSCAPGRCRRGGAHGARSTHS